jgi:malonate-semialdehyde dehydrogenase (acetylating) / methylmalonate-semialdehyde dehydrogenase
VKSERFDLGPKTHVWRVSEYDSRGIIMSVAAPPITRLSNHINGQWQDSQASEWREVVNPASGEVLAGVPMGDAADVNAAVEAAAAAFPEWRRTPP